MTYVLYVPAILRTRQRLTTSRLPFGNSLPGCISRTNAGTLCKLWVVWHIRVASDLVVAACMHLRFLPVCSDVMGLGFDVAAHRLYDVLASWRRNDGWCR